MLRAWRHRGSCRTPQEPRAWLRTIVQREVARAIGRRPPATEPLADGVEEHDDLTPVLDRDALRPALSALDPSSRAVIWLHYFADMSVADVATTLDMPVGTVKVKLARSRDKLRQRLPEHPSR